MSFQCIILYRMGLDLYWPTRETSTIKPTSSIGISWKSPGTFNAGSKCWKQDENSPRPDSLRDKAAARGQKRPITSVIIIIVRRCRRRSVAVHSTKSVVHRAQHQVVVAAHTTYSIKCTCCAFAQFVTCISRLCAVRNLYSRLCAISQRVFAPLRNQSSIRASAHREPSAASRRTFINARQAREGHLRTGRVFFSYN